MDAKDITDLKVFKIGQLKEIIKEHGGMISGNKTKLLGIVWDIVQGKEIEKRRKEARKRHLKLRRQQSRRQKSRKPKKAKPTREIPKRKQKMQKKKR